MPQQQENMIVKATISEGENMSEIQSLALRVRDLTQSVDRWNTVMLWTLICVAIAAIAVVLATRIVLTQGKKLADAQSELLDAKDRDARADSLDKELKILEAKKEATKAQLQLSMFARRSGDRVLDSSKFVEGLKGHAVKTVEIWYKPDDTEAERFSDDVCRALKSLGWPVSVKPLSQNELGGYPLVNPRGIVMFSRHIEDSEPFPMLIPESLQFGGSTVSTTARELPDGKLVIVVGIRDKL
jgi:hypothetical protein